MECDISAMECDISAMECDGVRLVRWGWDDRWLTLFFHQTQKAMIQRFEDLDCWKAARLLAKAVFFHSRQGPLSVDWDTRSQFRRAAVSIMNNLAEGFGRFGDRDKLRFYDIAKCSAMEVKSMLYLLEDIEYFQPALLTELHRQTDDAIRLTAGLIRHLNNRKPGTADS
jgi:four helix bundle protein